MLTSKEMTELLHVDRSTIYRMAEAGRLPAVKVGKQWRFPKSQVNNWLQSQGLAELAQPETQLTVQTQPASFPKNDEFSNLFPLHCVQLIQDTFADALGVMMIVTDINGQPATQISNPCGLFEAISDQPQAVQKCVEQWQELAHKLDLEPKFSPSHLGGLLCARAMIRVGTELQGMVFVGGIAPQSWPPAAETVQTVAAEFGVNPQIINAHINDVYYLNQDEQAHVLSLVQRIANIVAYIIDERTSLMSRLDTIAQLAR